MKTEIDVPMDLIEFFKSTVDDNTPIEKLLVQMLDLLRHILVISNKDPKMRAAVSTACTCSRQG